MNAADVAFVTALVRRSGTSFYHGMKVLPAPRRDAMYAVYAFCRAVDDIADDDVVEIGAKRAALEGWRQRVRGLYLGQSSDEITRCLLAAVRTYDLREADFLAVIDGMEMDGIAIVAPPLAELDLYCDRVASAVGRLSVRVFGEPGAAGQELAHALGRALQLTNILRDVPEDAERGRLYLPAEFLRAAGVPETPEAALAAPELPAVCERVAEMAERKFAEAEAAMARCDAKAIKPARLMAASYRPLLGILRARNYDYGQKRVSLPKWRKLVLAGRLLVS